MSPLTIALFTALATLSLAAPCLAVDGPPFPGWRSHVWPEAPPAAPLAGWRVALDPGHGGSDSGACGPDGYPCEKDLTLSIAVQLRRALEANGAAVGSTRTGDEALSIASRRTFANDFGAHRFISIHLNTAPGAPAAAGIETWIDWDAVSDPAPASAVWRDYAQAIHAETVAGARRKAPDLPDRGLRFSGRTPPWDTQRIAVIRPARDDFPAGVRMPAVLLEFGFLSNPTERSRLVRDAYQQALAQGVVAGLISHARRYRPSDGLIGP
ncbi:MAG TPA: N-acetylmuramoyl-L-alanine amidase [Limnochordia bacterium]